jgi:metal-responsive CopG/Arc/MetJ family transcriptional regulator
MANAIETELIGVTLPKTWVQAIDKHTGLMKSRQDIIRDILEPKILEWQKEV